MAVSTRRQYRSSQHISPTDIYLVFLIWRNVSPSGYLIVSIEDRDHRRILVSPAFPCGLLNRSAAAFWPISRVPARCSLVSISSRSASRRATPNRSRPCFPNHWGIRVRARFAVLGRRHGPAPVLCSAHLPDRARTFRRRLRW